MNSTRKLIAHAVAAVATLTVGVFASAGISHADTTTGTDACLDGHQTTVIIGAACGPDTPTASVVCAHGWAHLTLGDHDYCKPPKVVLVGEYELGTDYVPRIFPGSRLDVKMAPRTTRANRARCAKLGGTLVKGRVCRGVNV